MIRRPPWERYAEYVAYFKPQQRQRLYRPEFAAETATCDSFRFLRDAYRASDARDPVEKIVDADAHTYLPGDLLVKMDVATMAHSLEVRSPFLDHELFEMAASLPFDAKLNRAGVGKRILKDAVREWLPGEILDRPKMGFRVPIGDWLRGPLRELPREILLDPASVGRGWFRRREVERLIDDHVAGRSANENKLWALLQLELWMRSYVDPARPAPVEVEAPPLAGARP